QRTLADRHYFAAQLQLAGRAIEARQFEVAQDLLDAITPDERTGRTIDFAWNYLRTLARRQLVRLPGRAAQLSSMALAGNRRIVAGWYSDNTIVLWDLATEHTFQTIGPVKCRNLALSEDGRILAAEEGAIGTKQFEQITVWESYSGRVLSRHAI